MGEKLLIYYRRLSNEWKIAFFSAMAIGLICHIYKFTNALPGQDTPYNYYSDQNMIVSGRWFLTVACGLSSYYDLQWINGLLSMIWIALSSPLIIDIFKVRNPILTILISGLLVSFPAVTQTLYYGYTADGYFLAMLLSTIAVWLTLTQTYSLTRVFTAICCICLSCGIYQAYVSFAIVLVVIYILIGLLNNEFNTCQIKKILGRHLVIFASSLALYYVIWKVLMAITGAVPTDYMGISKMEFSVMSIIYAIPTMIVTMARFFLEHDPTEDGWTLFSILNMFFLFCFITANAVAIKRSELYKNKVFLVIYLLGLLALPIASCIWLFTSNTLLYGSRMLMSICLYYIFAAILFERFFSYYLKNLFAVFLLVFVFNNTINANISYYYMNRCYFTTYSFASEIMQRVHLLDCRTNKMAVIGNIEEEVRIKNDQTVGSNLLFDEVHTVLFINETFGKSYTCVSSDWRQNKKHQELISQMGCWPSSTSIKVIDDVIVIKINELASEK